MVAEPEISLLTGKKYFFGVHKVETTFGFNSLSLSSAAGIRHLGCHTYLVSISSG